MSLDEVSLLVVEMDDALLLHGVVLISDSREFVKKLPIPVTFLGCSILELSLC